MYLNNLFKGLYSKSLEGGPQVLYCHRNCPGDFDANSAQGAKEAALTCESGDWDFKV